MSTTVHLFNYARVNSQNIGMHVFGAKIVWQHCRRGVLSVDGETVRFACRYVASNGKTGWIVSRYPWIAGMARGMVIR